KSQLAHFAYNNGGMSVTAAELAGLVRQWLPEAKIAFDESKPATPLIDRMDGRRLEREIDFQPRPLLEGIRAHINEARTTAGVETCMRKHSTFNAQHPGRPLQKSVAQVSKPAVSPASRPAVHGNFQSAADLEIRDTADLEVCARTTPFAEVSLDVGR